MPKNILTYIIFTVLLCSLFGFTFVINLIGNFLILVFLIPILFIFIAFLSFNSLKSKIQSCNNCGSTIIGSNETCIYCGASLDNALNKETDSKQKASETTIEIEAEEIN